MTQSGHARRGGADQVAVHRRRGDRL